MAMAMSAVTAASTGEIIFQLALMATVAAGASSASVVVITSTLTDSGLRRSLFSPAEIHC